MTLLIDLDGTLLNARARLHELFRHLVPSATFDQNAYWALKRAKTNHAQILRQYFSYDDAQIAAFEASWLGLIEQQEWLDKDVPYDGVTEHLAKLAKTSHLYLVTARQKPEMVEYQLKKNGWLPFFAKVFVTGGAKTKAEILDGVKLEANDWFIGDTGLDVKTGRALGVRTAVVTCGFLSLESLQGYGPDKIVEDFTQFEP